MTAIEKREVGPQPSQTYAGYAWPGLGHLLVGEWVHGLGMMSITALCALGIVLGLPTLSTRLFLSNGVSWHTLLALLTVPAVLAALWFRAHRRVFPRVLDEAEFNSNRNVFLRQIRRHRSGMLGFYGICLLLLAMVITPLLAPYDPNVIDVGPPTAAPGWWQHVAPMIGWSTDAAQHGWLDYPMGTDERGRDVLSRLLFGARISLMIGFVAVALAASIGTVVGATAGYLGAWVDRILMWFVDLLLAMPRLILLLAVVGIIDLGGTKRLFLIIGVLGLTGWMGVSRIVRSQVLSLKQQDFVQAARALGYSQGRIVLQHLIPNAMAPVIVFCSLAIGGTMLAEAGLSFLGLGVQPPTSTWGVMVNEGRPTLRDAPWISMFPGLAIVAAVMCFNLLGDGLRDALDPKQRT
ncbi:MAG: ABC transporter permease [Myxococcota bacterium]